jgi:hypothetical protein
MRSTRTESPLHRRVVGTTLALAAASCLLGCASTLRDRSVPASRAPKTVVYECTFLRAQPEKRDRLKRFIRANWFAMDLIAQQQGLVNSFQLLEPRQQEGNSNEAREWDLLVKVGYPTPGGYSDIAEAFEVIRRAHTTVLIDGLDFRALGQIVTTSVWVDRSDDG